MCGSAPNCRSQSPSPSTTSVSDPEIFASFRKPRPKAGCTRSVSRKLAVTSNPRTLNGSPEPVRLKMFHRPAARGSKDWLCRFQSSKLPGATLFQSLVCPGESSMIMTMRSVSGNVTGRIRKASATLKIAVFAPIPRASVATAIEVNAKFLRNVRRL
jgi:hypothetical protein